jgi:uncharacterized membrane-anchored protein YitT (DUF2179 family)
MSEKEKSLLYVSRKQLVPRRVKDAVYMTLAVVCAAFGLNHFVVPHGILDGGVIGIALLVAHATGWSLGKLIFFINLPILALGFVKIGKRFALAGLLVITCFTVAEHYLPVAAETDDILLSAIFGGCLLGAGTGFAMRATSVLDGSEIVALLLSRRAGIQLGETVLAFNILIFVVAGFVLNVEKALYSTVTYFCAAKMMEFVLHGFEEYNAVTVISAKYEQVREAILKNTERGVTVYSAKGGYSGETRDVVVCVVTRLEVPSLKNLIYETDPHAFILVHALHEASGGMVKRRPFAH